MFSFFVLVFLLSASARAELKNESQAGVVIAGGNSRSQSLSLQQENSYTWEKNTLGFKGNFLQSKSFGVLDAKRWDAALRYERALTDRLSVFLGQGVESDRFAGFMQRYNTDIGPKYIFIKNQGGLDWSGELGYRYSLERRLDSTRVHKNQVRAYTELNKKWNEGTSSKFWVEYLPNFSQSEDWLLNSELSTSAAFNAVFSVKLAYLIKYDNEPAPSAIHRTDSLFTTALVAHY
jgi:putative salt-induced outer membrane protein